MLSQANFDALRSIHAQKAAIYAAFVADDVPVTPPQPSSTGLVVRTAANVSDVNYRDRSVRQWWTRPLGDFGQDGASLGTAQPGVPFDVSAYPNGIVLLGAAVSAVTVDGSDAGAFYNIAGSNRSKALPSHPGDAVIVPRGGKTMVVTAAGASHVYALECPPVPDYAPVGPRREPDVLSVIPTSLDAITKTVKGTIQASGDVFHGCATRYGVDRLPYVEITTADSLLGRMFGEFLPVPPCDELCMQYGLWIDDGDEFNVWDGLNDLGVKLSGFCIASPTRDWTDPNCWDVCEHSGIYYGERNPLNRNIFGLDRYVRDADTGTGAIAEPPRAYGLLAGGRMYRIEKYLKLGTPGVADGVRRTYINGHLVDEQTNRRFRYTPDMLIRGVHWQLYLGGVAHWLKKVRYRLGQIEVSTQPIGVPSELR